MLSVVIACYNEEANIPRFAPELLPALKSLDQPWELVLVNDGSNDATAAALSTLAAGHSNIQIVSLPHNQGMGAALRAGFAQAQGDWIATLDADLTFSPADISRLLARQVETGADMIAGSPYLSSDGMAEISWTRRLPSLLINAFYRGLIDFRLTAYTPIFRLYRASVLKSLTLKSSGFEINAEIAARLLRARKKVAEVPVRLSVRREGTSKLNRGRELAHHLRLALELLARAA